MTIIHYEHLHRNVHLDDLMPDGHKKDYRHLSLSHHFMWKTNLVLYALPL